MKKLSKSVPSFLQKEVGSFVIFN